MNGWCGSGKLACTKKGVLIAAPSRSRRIGFVGVALFTGVTAWDVQRMQRGQMAFLKNRESAAVLGALALYLDFLNIFLFMLRIFSGRN